MNICGVVIWYNPGIQEVQNIKSYVNHLDKLIVVDNSSNNNESLLKGIKNIKYIANFDNLGIAKALNIGCKTAIEYGYKWVLTMDQDSSFCEYVITKYIELFKQMSEKEPEVAIFGPHTYEDEQCGYVNKIITSGNILNLNAYKEVNGFDDNLFIDEVDFDICFKLLQKGYKVYKFDSIKLEHKLGDSKTINVGNKKISAMNHNHIRKYYIMRNRCLMKSRYPEYTQNYTKDNLKDIIKVILIEDNKIKKLKYMCKGYIDFKKNNLGKLNELN